MLRCCHIVPYASPVQRPFSPTTPPPSDMPPPHAIPRRLPNLLTASDHCSWGPWCAFAGRIAFLVSNSYQNSAAIARPDVHRHSVWQAEPSFRDPYFIFFPASLSYVGQLPHACLFRYSLAGTRFDGILRINLSIYYIADSNEARRVAILHNSFASCPSLDDPFSTTQKGYTDLYSISRFPYNAGTSFLPRDPLSPRSNVQSAVNVKKKSALVVIEVLFDGACGASNMQSIKRKPPSSPLVPCV